ncbi:DUF427 domain-containing protein [Salipiger sp. H15]|uniref:DUF427 domain-containing protein n=1 Tax=Alloyangia sp. H15 TaxID=3029062 RepID=A0AAU8ADP7_9RHOB
MLKQIAVRPATGTWVIRAGGAVLGESSRALELTEGEKPLTIYFPREDVAMAFLEPSAYRSTSAALGDAEHYHIASKSRTYANAVFSYMDPKPEAAGIKGYLAFDLQDGVAVEQV